MILVTGSGSGGSWRVRAEQLGAAIGATVKPRATRRDVARAEVVIIVKRPVQEAIDTARADRKPVVFDLVDGYPQPHGNKWERDDCMRWLSATLKSVRPALTIGATVAMADDIRSLGYKAIHLYHHGRPGIQHNPIREHIRIIGYEGASHYVEHWSSKIAIYGSKHHASVSIVDGKEDALFKFDIALGLRDQCGYAATHWKSNCKISNAQASGTPFICGYEKGCTETASGAEYFVRDYAEFCTAMEWLKDQSARKSASEIMKKKAITLESVAAEYLRAIHAL